MILSGSDGSTFEMSIDGYQFPDAQDPQWRFSWYMISGRAATAEEQWAFRWQALTCDEAPTISTWLRLAAQWGDAFVDLPPRPLSFTEPNLRFTTVARRAPLVAIDVALAHEFLPPNRPPERRFSRDPALVRLEVTGESLRQAADELDADIERYPDGLAGFRPSGRPRS